MKKTMWKWKAVLTLLICMAAVGGNWSGCKVQAEERDADTGLCYEVVNEEIVITGYYKSKTKLKIPDTMLINAGRYLPVTSIGDDALFEYSGLTSIEIPASVKSIGTGVFTMCYDLIEIKVDEGNEYYTSQNQSGQECNAIITKNGEKLVCACATTNLESLSSVKIIGDSAFSNSSLESITIPDSVESIEDYAFHACSGLTSIIIPANVKNIGEAAFHACSELTSISFTDNSNLTNIGKRAFSECIGLTAITIPDSVTSIGAYAFSECESLKAITIPDSVESINSGIFSHSGLTSILFEDNFKLTSIGACAFMECKSLTSITIPDSVESIGAEAFSGSGLTSIEIPKNVKNIGDMAFSNCSNLGTIKVDENNLVYTSKGTVDNELRDCNAIITKNGEKLLCGCNRTKIPIGVKIIESHAFSECESLKEITIPDGVESISWEAFSGCSSLMAITIPDSVESIGEYAFSGCSSLTTITIPKNVTSIEHDVFSDCESLKKITIPDSVESIGERAFSGSGLISIEIPKNVTSIEKGAFSNCFNLGTIKVDENNPIYTSKGKVDNKLLECNAIITKNNGEELVCGCNGTKIPIGVEIIRPYAFSGSGLTSIEIPKNVKKIGDSAFSYSSLESITIPDSVESIGNSAFEDCRKLTSIIIPSVKEIGDSAFRDCNKDLVIYTLRNSIADVYARYHGIKVDYNMNPTSTTPEGDQGTTSGTAPTTPEGDQGATPGTTPTTPSTPSTTPTTEAPAQINVPAAKGTSLQAEKAEVKVTSDNAANPTVEYAANTDKSAKKVTVPDTVTVDGITYQVTSVAAKAFAKNKKVTSVTIGKNVTSIGKDAFKNCTSLKSVTIQSAGLTKIENGAFSGDKKLTKITIKTTKLSKKSIGKNALKGTSKKLVIKVPKKQVEKYKTYFKGKGNKSVKVTK